MAPQRNDAAGSETTGTRKPGTPKSGSGDPRAARTRLKLVDAMRSLAEEGELEASVSSIVSRAGLNRSSFYAHFANPQELALYTLGEVFDAISSTDIELRSEGTVSGRDAARIAIGGIVRHVDRHRATFGVLFASAGGLAQFADLLAARILVFHGEFAPADVARRARPSSVFVAYGLTGLIAAWIADDAPSATSDLVNSLVAELPEWMASVGPTRD